MKDRTPKPVEVGTELGIADLNNVARHENPVALAESAVPGVTRAREAVDEIIRAGKDAAAVYGVNTGFGALAETRIEPDRILDLQRNLVRSHACGIGPDMPRAQVRGLMLLRAQTIAFGHSGVRKVVIDLLVEMLNRGVTPRIPAQGSVGASGDLAPLAHLALVLIGEGQAHVDGELLPGGAALSRVGLEPLELQAKEGLGLINGTQYMTSYGALALSDAAELAKIADIAGAMTLEAHKGSERPFEARVHALRPHPGQSTVAKNLRTLLAESELMDSHRFCSQVQDAYSLRCMPQVHGASRDALGWATGVVECEMNSVTDNPLVFPGNDGERSDFISGGNFHGQPIAFALDLAAMALAELGNISERRVEQLVNPALSTGLPAFLTKESGLNSGFMIAQVASASLVSENKILCHPASVDSIPSSAGREDHVSMGSVSGRKLSVVVDNVRLSLAIEVLTAAAGLDLRHPLTPAAGVAAAHAAVRRVVAPLEEDRPLHEDIQKIAELIRSGELIAAAESRVGTLA